MSHIELKANDDRCGRDGGIAAISNLGFSTASFGGLRCSRHRSLIKRVGCQGEPANSALTTAAPRLVAQARRGCSRALASAANANARALAQVGTL
jgi:hypothetical protein